ncbi:MAG: sigma-54-dependent Fis family transcriptional regulator [Candidatus Marinimicrobia bacterium]|nr:sigma-54-dependent Fis family transcriptional regulator [Candidatus Neomarinimicrobiota bacterium]
MQFNILIVDDEKIVGTSMKRILENEEKTIQIAQTVGSARKILKSEIIDIVLLDYQLGETDGITFLCEIRENFPEILVIMVTAFGSVETAVKAMKIGAFDFVEKREDASFLRYTVQRAVDNLRLKKEVEHLQFAHQQDTKLPQIIAESPAMKDVLNLGDSFAAVETTILITGETGTGKNLLARYIHSKSQRFNQPFITLNCAAIPSELIESELFGYSKGAFTGANTKGKLGLIDQANGGTLFLDEIGDLNLDLQSKILHILENNEFYRVGAVKPVQADVRFIAATNRQLPEMIERKEFRMDLFYRLNVAEIEIPPLRKRQEDILPLAKLFIQNFNRKFGKNVNEISEYSESILVTNSWIGNIRELKNVIERSMLLSRSESLELVDCSNLSSVSIQNKSFFSVDINPDENANLIQIAQNQLVEQALEATNQNRSQAAKLLGIPRTTLNHYIKKLITPDE